MSKFWIRFGVNNYGEWEEIEAENLEEAESEAYDLALEDAQNELCYEAVGEIPYE